MPIYEYRCQNCQCDFEYLVIGGHAPDQCPQCNSANVTKLISASTFFSKGSGGETVSATAGSSSCSGCAASSCAGCSH